VAVTRLQFLGSAAASCVVVALNGPTALAATTSADGQVAGRVLDALALTPFNDLPPRDWTAFAEQRLGQMAAGERQAFAGLRGESSRFARMAPEEAARTLAALLVPGYDGGRGIDEAQWTAEIEAQRASVANAPSIPVPANSGTFDRIGVPSSQAVRDGLLVGTSAVDLHASRAAFRALEAATAMAATVIAANGADDRRGCLGVQL
jgi:hypothetical protein